MSCTHIMEVPYAAVSPACFNLKDARLRGSESALLVMVLADRQLSGCVRSCVHLSHHLWLRWVPEEYRGRALTVIHASFSLGMVFGMLATPLLVVHFGWPGALMGLTLLGLAWAVSCPNPARCGDIG